MLLEYANDVLVTFAWFVLGASLCTLAEFFFSAQEQTSMSRVRGFCFSFCSLAAAVFATNLAQSMMAQAGLRPWLQFDLTGTISSSNMTVLVAAYTVVPLLSVFAYDVGYYLFHRLQHTVPWLWRYHAVHHSIEELNSFNSYHHVSEYFFRIPLLTIPINLLIWVGQPQIIVTGVILSAVGKLAHSNTKIGFGPFRYLFTEPRYHRVHHSTEEHHWNKNFAFYFPILDVLGRTAHFPSKTEYPTTGVNYVREPRSLNEFLFPPQPPARVASGPNAAAEEPPALAQA